MTRYMCWSIFSLAIMAIAVECTEDNAADKTADACPKVGPCFTGAGLDDDTVDTDGDGIYDVDDNCPVVANPDQFDWDSDGVGDACDNCPTMANPEQADADTGCGNCAEMGNPDHEVEKYCFLKEGYNYDTDGDSICNGSITIAGLCFSGPDNCPDVSNRYQEDGDGDGIGDACDNCPNWANPDQEGPPQQDCPGGGDQ